MKRYFLPVLLLFLLFLLLSFELGKSVYKRYYETKVKEEKTTPQVVEIPPVEPVKKEEVIISSPPGQIPKPVEKKIPLTKPVVEISTQPPAGMVYIPPGEFIIGSDEGTEFEKPKRKIYLKGYFIDKYEVTNAEYKKFIEATGHPAPKGWVDTNYPTGKGNYPVTNVTYADAETYAKWAGKRLPSEEEWEKAARGVDGRKYPWGDSRDGTAANVRMQFKGSSLRPVGSFPKGVSPYGGYDFSGNVWEWTTSHFDKRYRVIRGGSFLQPAELARTSFRDFYEPDKYREDIGFRCVKDVK